MTDSKAAEDLFDKPHGPVPTMEEALRPTLAKEVERLRAENERLRAQDAEWTSNTKELIDAAVRGRDSYWQAEVERLKHDLSVKYRQGCTCTTP